MSITAVFLNAIMPMVRYTFWLGNLIHCHQLYVSTLSMKPCRTHKTSTRTHLPIDKQTLQRLQLVSSKDSTAKEGMNHMNPLKYHVVSELYTTLVYVSAADSVWQVCGLADCHRKSRHDIEIYWKAFRNRFFFRGYCFVGSIMLRIHAEPGLWLNPNT